MTTKQPSDYFKQLRNLPDAPEAQDIDPAEALAEKLVRKYFDPRVQYGPDVMAAEIRALCDKKTANLREDVRRLTLGLAHAYVANYREGWELGLSDAESWQRVSDELANIGLLDLNMMVEFIASEYPDSSNPILKGDRGDVPTRQG